MAQPHLAAVAPRRELEPGEGVDRHRVGLDAAHVAEDDVGVTPLSSAQTRSQSPGRSARAMGPVMVKASGRGAKRHLGKDCAPA